MYVAFYKSQFKSQLQIPFTDYLGKCISHPPQIIGSLLYYETGSLHITRLLPDYLSPLGEGENGKFSLH
jgi:hypothetical protein